MEEKTGKERKNWVKERIEIKPPNQWIGKVSSNIVEYLYLFSWIVEEILAVFYVLQAVNY